MCSFCKALFTLPSITITVFPRLLNTCDADLHKHTDEEHADFENLSKALQKMKEVADYVNERKREAENLSKVYIIMKKLTGKDVEVN